MSIRSAMLAAIERRAGDLAELARRIHAHPELRMEEHQAAAWLTEAVEAAGVPVRGVGGLATAFRARIGRPGGPHVAILAEYDALPEIGHACGHNLIGTGAVGAFLGLAAVADRLGGEVVLLGTPGEEGGGGKNQAARRRRLHRDRRRHDVSPARPRSPGQPGARQRSPAGRPTPPPRPGTAARHCRRSSRPST